MDFEVMKEMLAKFLEANARHTPYTAAHLARLLGMDRHSDWHRQIRRAVEELVIDGCPIGGNTNGYLWITTDVQLQRYLNTLQQRQVALCLRIANLYKAYNGYHGRK